MTSGRLDLRQIDVSAPDFLLSDLQDWRRQIDALYSIDAMVHVDLQYLMAYLITAAAVLRPDGKLVMTLATTGTEEGFSRLVQDVSRYWSAQGSPTGSGKLEWVSGSMLESLLPRLGFEIEFLWEPQGIYVMFVASLRRPEVGDQLASGLVRCSAVSVGSRLPGSTCMRTADLERSVNASPNGPGRSMTARQRFRCGRRSDCS